VWGYTFIFSFRVYLLLLLLLQGYGVYGAVLFFSVTIGWVGGWAAWYITFLVSPFSSFSSSF
jgi:hypothetical protein